MMSDIKKGILLIIIVFFAAACAKDPLPPKASENPFFSFDLPEGYYHVNQPSKDTYVGYYNGPNGSFGYDCGNNSFGMMEDIQPSKCSYYEEATVDGVLAKIVIHETGSGRMLSMYIDKDGEWKKLRVYTDDPSKEEFFFFCKVFKSLRFK